MATIMKRFSIDFFKDATLIGIKSFGKFDQSKGGSKAQEPIKTKNHF